METKKYEVEIKEAKGTCDNSLFTKMAKKGDISAIKINQLLGAVVTIMGYAKCHIVTEEKDFEINYFDTEEYGLISSGSEIFTESVIDYFEEVDNVRITEIRTRKGKTYKAIPVLKQGTNKKEEATKNEEETTDDLPF